MGHKPILLGHMHLRPLVFPDLTQPNGFLDSDMGCQACWYFYTCAERIRQIAGKSIDSQIIVVDAGDDNGVAWMNKNYENIARGIAMLYGLDSPDEFQRYWPLVMLQCGKMEYPIPHPEYTGRLRLHNVNV
jgi:hypothetical protein